MSTSPSSPPRPRPSPLEFWSSSSAVILAALVNVPRTLQNAESSLKSLREVAQSFHDSARSGEAPDVVGLLLALGRVKEAMHPLAQLSDSLLDATGELRQGVEALLSRPPA